MDAQQIKRPYPWASDAIRYDVWLLVEVAIRYDVQAPSPASTRYYDAALMKDVALVRELGIAAISEARHCSSSF